MRHYMQTLRERGEILDVHREVDPKHELAAVTQVAMRRWTTAAYGAEGDIRGASRGWSTLRRADELSVF